MLAEAHFVLLSFQLNVVNPEAFQGLEKQENIGTQTKTKQWTLGNNIKSSL